MALKPCRECGKEVSTEAKVCPHCGVAKPVPPTPMTPAQHAGVFGCLILVLLGVGYCFYSAASTDFDSLNRAQSQRIEPTAPASPAPPQQQAAASVPFKVIGKEEMSVSIVVPKATTDEQLVALVNRFRSAREAGTLATMIPPTTPGGSNGPYGGVQVFIFTDPAWASTAHMHSFIFATTSKSTGSNKVFLEKIRAYYYYTSFGQHEVGSIVYGYADEDKSSTYRLLFQN